MSFDPRSRMISFRLTADEYDRCREACFTRGLRSVSEMARTAINLLVQQPTLVPQGNLEGRVSNLESRVHILALELKRLHQISSPKSVTPSNSGPAGGRALE